MAEALELADIQGLLVRGYGNLPAATFVLLGIGDSAAARGWLGRLAERVTSGQQRPDDEALHLALSPSGLSRLGLPDEALSQFSHEFVTGMTTPHRQRILGDVGPDAPEGWAWSGLGQRSVDLVLLVYAVDENRLAARLAALEVEWAGAGLTEVRRLETAPLDPTEHFGFRDGISQPLVEGLPRAGSPLHTVKAGEFVLGYPNEHGQLTDRPMLPGESDRANLLPTADGGRRDLGRNGTYLVFRQLRQDVRGFWRYVDEQTRRADGSSDPAARAWLASRMVGRWPGGAPLATAPLHDDPRLAEWNEFGYGLTDPSGQSCPLGAHVRRANPRDSLDPEPGTDRSVEINRRHRILRRGRKYGPPVPPESLFEPEPAIDDEDRGLHFIGLCANLQRQFEFIQHTWVNNPKFEALYDDVDPVVGSRRPGANSFTIQASPVRRRLLDLPRFVTVRGGGYFFLPGIRALRYLAALGPA